MNTQFSITNMLKHYSIYVSLLALPLVYLTPSVATCEPQSSSEDELTNEQKKVLEDVKNTLELAAVRCRG